MVSPTSEVLNGEIQDNAQSTHQAGKTAQVKHEEEYANNFPSVCCGSLRCGLPALAASPFYPLSCLFGLAPK